MRREGGWLPVAVRWVACGLFAVMAWQATPAPPESEPTEDRIEIVGNVTDQAGQAVADAQVKLVDGLSGEILDQTVSDDSGRFELAAEKNPQYVAHSCYLHAETSAGQRMALDPAGEFRDGSYQMAELPRKLVLSPTVDAPIKVVNSIGVPVADCNVVMRLIRLNIQLKQSTGKDGTVTFRYPQDSKVLQLVAWKDQQGFSAASFLADRRDRGAKEPAPFDPSGMTLELSGAREIKVRVVDSGGQPVEKARVYPWLLNSPKRVSQISLFTL